MPPIPDKTIERLLDRVRRPSRYLGREMHEARKDPAAVGVRVCLAFPEVYEIGMSHLGLRILYDLLNQEAEFFAERAFCPWPDMEELMRQDDVPLWSLESHTPVAEFDVVGFSLQSELVGTNVLTMLDLAGIPLLAADRNDEHPLVIGGGPVVFNSEPLAAFFDCFLIGDGEAAFPAFLKKYLSLKRAGEHDRQTLLTELSTGEGIYVPALYSAEINLATGFAVVQDSGKAPSPVRKAMVDDLAEYPFPTNMLIPQGEIVHDRYAVEIARGCTEGCRFCQAGMVYRPQRERPPREIVESIATGIDRTGYDEASLTALSTADYSGIDPLARAVTQTLVERNAAMSVSSLRAYGITKNLAADIAGLRKTGFTIAPEAGTQRLRDVINKGITDEDITSAAGVAFSAGWKLLKFYFMIGLPTETDEDVAAIAETAIRVLKMSASAKGRPRAKINVAVASFIPKPHSPFAWAAFDDPQNLKRKQELLLSQMRKYKNIRVKFHAVEQSWLEAIMARGDRRLAHVIQAAWENGARFDEWDEGFKKSTWDEAFTNCGIDPAQYLASFPLDARLPWDHIDSGVDVEFLRREFKRGLEGKFTTPCEKPPPKAEGGGKLVCYSCGLACDLEAIADRRTRGNAELRELAASSPGKPKAVDRRAADAQTYRYRLAYGKTGWSRYLSHLEVVRVWQRAFRRAGIKLAYSAGFHPHPKMSFGPALPVGVGGTEEYLDFQTTDCADPEKISDALTRALPKTFPLVALRRISRNAPGIEKTIETFLYEIIYPERAGDLTARITKKIDAGEWIIVRKKEQKVREFDARPYITSVTELRSAGVSGVALELKNIEGRSVKPGELIESLLGEIPPGMRIIRRRMGKYSGHEFKIPMDVV